MTTIIDQFTTLYARSSPYRTLTDGLAIIIAILLLTFLIEKVLLDAFEGRPVEYKTQAFVIVVLPFLFVIASVIFLRTAQILHLF